MKEKATRIFTAVGIVLVLAWAIISLFDAVTVPALGPFAAGFLFTGLALTEEQGKNRKWYRRILWIFCICNFAGGFIALVV